MIITNLPPLPERPEDGHKGTFGRVLIIGGSRGMSGAIALSGKGALRSGAGLVSLAIPDSVSSTVATLEPSYLTIPLPDDAKGRISREAQSTLEAHLELMDAAAIGPGLNRSPDLDHLVSQLYGTSKVPMVLDADALNSLADQSQVLSDHSGPRILTPHPGEFARLIGSDPAEVQRHRKTLALEFAARHNLILVLKGKGTVVTDGLKSYVNSTGNAGMATGGTGDVLTGIIASLLAQKMAPFAAAQLGVYIHGIAGDLATGEMSQRGMIASDLIQFLPYAWKKIEVEH